ncbi:hypothetical protein SAZ11_00750 [Streptomyces sp. FXJ1.4098]|nr:hypothetical protein [Streptomyces sp. FXJ1.4098]
MRSASAVEEVTAIPRGAPRSGLAARPTSRPRTAVDSDGVQTPRTSETSAAQSDGEAEAATSAEPAGDARASGGIRGWASRLGRDSVATAAADGRADGVGATATAAAGSGPDFPDPDGDSLAAPRSPCSPVRPWRGPSSSPYRCWSWPPARTMTTRARR